MTKRTVKNVEMISNEELCKVSGGGLPIIGLSDTPRPGMGEPIKRDKKDEPKDGGVTGSW